MYIRKILTLLFALLLFIPQLLAAPKVFATDYKYDLNGNLISDSQNCYTYNDANQLAQVKNCASGKIVAQYTYDYQGNRIKKALFVNGILSKIVYSPDKSYETTKIATSSALLNTSYYYVNGELAARKNPDGSKNYYLNDDLGSAVALTNQSGTVMGKTAYDPFGQILGGGTQSKQLYTGQENDSETNLDYYNARYYNPSIGRFTQPDTQIADVYNPQNLNRYSYVNNNPMTNVDPSGHFLEALLDYVITPIWEDIVIPAWEYVQPYVESVAEKIAPIAESFGSQISSFFSEAEPEIQSAASYESNTIIQGLENNVVNQYSNIGSTGQFGQNLLEQMEPNGIPQYSWTNIPGFTTARYSDLFNEFTGTAYEAKTGYQALTQSNSIQILKDQALMSSGQINSMSYDFFRSPVTGLIGPSQPYYDALKNAGFTINIWDNIKP